MQKENYYIFKKKTHNNISVIKYEEFMKVVFGTEAKGIYGS